jgi:hypothetical protein
MAFSLEPQIVFLFLLVNEFRRICIAAAGVAQGPAFRQRFYLIHRLVCRRYSIGRMHHCEPFVKGWRMRKRWFDLKRYCLTEKGLFSRKAVDRAGNVAQATPR